MFTENPIGLLTIQIPPNGEYEDSDATTVTLEVATPLLEGGLVYRGLFSGLHHPWVGDVAAYATKNVLDSVRFSESEIYEEDGLRFTTYELTIGSPGEDEVEDDEGGRSGERYQSIVHVSPEDPKQFAGTVEGDRGYAKFTYKDLREPVTFGSLIIIVSGIAAVLCATSLIVGSVANRHCKKVKVTYGFGFNLGWRASAETKVGCNVECVEGKG